MKEGALRDKAMKVAGPLRSVSHPRSSSLCFQETVEFCVCVVCLLFGNQKQLQRCTVEAVPTLPGDLFWGNNNVFVSKESQLSDFQSAFFGRGDDSSIRKFKIQIVIIVCVLGEIKYVSDQYTGFLSGD